MYFASIYYRFRQFTKCFSGDNRTTVFFGGELSDGRGLIEGESVSEAGESDGGEGIRLKGAQSRLVLFRQIERGAEAAERLREGALVRPGDVLQVSYIAAGASDGVILSIDGRGVLTQHFPPPQAPSAATRLVQGGAIPLTSAYELDDAPAFERFFFVTSSGPTPLRVDLVTRAAEALAAR